MNKVFKIASLFICCLLVSMKGVDNTNAKIKAIFIYNFTKYIEWPVSYKKGDFIIGVLGETPLLKELSALSASKKAGQQPLRIMLFSSIKSIEKCHILFLTAESRVNMKELANKLKGRSTLLITEKSGMLGQGAAINFVVQNNKQEFELSKLNAEMYNLKVSSYLTVLALNK